MSDIDTGANRNPKLRRGRPPLSDGDLSPVDCAPWGTHGRGSVMRSTRLTPLGWAYVSPEVRARLGVVVEPQRES